MKFTLLGSVYDDGGNEKVRNHFKKMSRWIQESRPAGKDNWRKILSKRYAGYLVESNSNKDLLENFCADCKGIRSCDSCSKMNGGSKMKGIDQQVNEAFNEPYQRPETKEEASFAAIYQITKDGQLIQTEQSKRDEGAYWQDQKEEESIEESEDLSTDGKILAAFN